MNAEIIFVLVSQNFRLSLFAIRLSIACIMDKNSFHNVSTSYRYSFLRFFVQSLSYIHLVWISLFVVVYLISFWLLQFFPSVASHYNTYEHTSVLFFLFICVHSPVLGLAASFSPSCVSRVCLPVSSRAIISLLCTSFILLFRVCIVLNLWRSRTKLCRRFHPFPRYVTIEKLKRLHAWQRSDLSEILPCNATLSS